MPGIVGAVRAPILRRARVTQEDPVLVGGQLLTISASPTAFDLTADVLDGQVLIAGFRTASNITAVNDDGAAPNAYHHSGNANDGAGNLISSAYSLIGSRLNAGAQHVRVVGPTSNPGHFVAGLFPTGLDRDLPPGGANTVGSATGTQTFSFGTSTGALNIPALAHAESWLVVILWQGNFTNTTNAPAGWTKLGSSTTGVSNGVSIFYKRVSTDAADSTFNTTFGGANSTFGLMMYRTFRARTRAR